MRIIPLCLIGTVLFQLTTLQAEKIPVVSWKKDPAGVTLNLTPGTLRLNVCSEQIVRVIYSPTAAKPALQNFTQIKQWTPVDFSVKETPDSIAVATKSLTVQVNRESGAVSFLDPSGKVILAEPDAGGKSMKPVEVNNEKAWQPEQTFQARADEYLHGMGQYQDGNWNLRGITLELRQQNTQVVVPFLVSSYGYGVLWNNASWSFFNPNDDQIPLEGGGVAVDPNMPKATEQLPGAMSGIKPAATPTPAPTPLPALPTGTFTAKQAGDYVFFASNGNRSAELSILVDGKPITGIVNMWTPYAVTGVASLKAGQTVQVQIRGGGNAVKLAVHAKQDDRTVFRSQVGDAIDYTFFYGPSLEKVIAGYRTATGTAPLLPKWAYGFWQCRERYHSQQELLDNAIGYRARSIPVDAIVQDWQYWGKYGFGAYQWDESTYPDPKGMITTLHDLNFHLMITVWPNPSGTANTALNSIHALVPDPEDSGFHIYDATNPDARKLRWKLLNDAFYSIGMDAWWQDAAEPTDGGNILNGKTLFLGSGNRLRNSYPLFHSEGVYEGQRGTDPNKRVCILTRSGYLGQQRYSTIIWSGDINGNWTTFKRQIPAGLNFCMAGIPYWTTDCGGFFRPDDQHTSPDYNALQARWFEWSTFTPILRIHGWQSETEFWHWLPDTQKILIAYDHLRYRMLPYNYSVAWQVTSAGSTMMRGLPMDFPNDPAVQPISDEYCFGPSLLVTPVTDPGVDHRSVYLPKGSDWYDFWTGEKSPGGTTQNASAPLDTIPLYVKAGSILPLGPDLQWTGQKPADPIELRVYTGAYGTFTLYEDEGDSYRYEKGAYATIPMTWNEKNQTLTIGHRQGSFTGMLAKRTFHIVWVGPKHGAGATEETKSDLTVTYGGKSISVKKS